MSAEKRRRRRGLGRSDAGRARRVSAGRAAAAPSAACVGPGSPGLAAGRPCRVQVGARGEDGRAWTGPGGGAGGPLRVGPGARTAVPAPRERRGRCRRSGALGAGPGPGPGPGAGRRDGDPPCPPAPAQSPRRPRRLAPRVRAPLTGRPPIWRARRGLWAEGLLPVTAGGPGEAEPGSPAPSHARSHARRGVAGPPPGPQRAPHAQSRGRSSRPRRRPRPPLCGSLRALPPPLLFAGPGPGSDGSPGARGPAATPPPPGTRRSAGSPADPQVRGRGRGTLILKGAPPAVVCTLTQWKALGRRSACYQLHVVPAAAVSPGG